MLKLGHNKLNLNNKIFFLKKKNFIIQKTFSIIFFFFDSSSEYLKKNKTQFLNYGFYSYFFPKNSLNLKTGSLSSSEILVTTLNLMESISTLKNLYFLCENLKILENKKLLKLLKIKFVLINLIFFISYVKILFFLTSAGNAKMIYFLKNLNSSKQRNLNFDYLFTQKFGTKNMLNFNYDLFSFNDLSGHHYFYTKNFFFFRRFCVDYFFRSDIFFSTIQKKKISFHFFKFFKKFKKMKRNFDKTFLINFYKENLNISDSDLFDESDNINSDTSWNRNYYLSDNFFLNFFFNKDLIPFGLPRNYSENEYECNFFFFKNVEENNVNLDLLLNLGSIENLKFVPLIINLKNEYLINFKSFFESFFFNNLKKTSEKSNYYSDSKNEIEYFNFFLNFFVVLQTISFGTLSSADFLESSFKSTNYFNYKTLSMKKKNFAITKNTDKMLDVIILNNHLIENVKNNKEKFMSNFCDFNRNYLNYFYLSGGLFFFFKDFFFFFLKNLFMLNGILLKIFFFFFKKFFYLLVRNIKIYANF